MTDLLDAEIVADDETRSFIAPFTLQRAKPMNGDDEEDDGLTLVGYAAVFNSPTRIAGMGGDFTEVIAPGAFRRTIRAQRPVMQFDHGQHPLIGSLPIAAIRSLAEDDRGLYVEARVFDNWLTEPLRDAIREEAISGMSFRFSVVKDSWTKTEQGDRVRTLKEVRLYELGPVVHPAYGDTSVALRSLERATGLILATPETPALTGTVDGPGLPDPATSHSVRTKNQRLALASNFPRSKK